MNIQHEDDGRRGRFFIEGDGSLLAEIVYSWNDTGDLVIHHTNVDALLEGRGIGKALVAQTVTLARERHSRIIPLCTFAKTLLDRTPEWQADVKMD